MTRTQKLGIIFYRFRELWGGPSETVGTDTLFSYSLSSPDTGREPDLVA